MTIPEDKRMHFITGCLIGGLFCCLFSMKTGIVAAAIAGMAKEVWDSYGHGTPDIWDAVATTAGGVIGAVGVLAL